MDHWYVKVINGGKQAASTNISVTLHNVINPASTSEQTTQAFQLFHVDSNDKIRA